MTCANSKLGAAILAGSLALGMTALSTGTYAQMTSPSNPQAQAPAPGGPGGLQKPDDSAERKAAQPAGGKKVGTKKSKSKAVTTGANSPSSPQASAPRPGGPGGLEKPDDSAERKSAEPPVRRR